MKPLSLLRFRAFWRRTSLLDRVGVAIALLAVVFDALRSVGVPVPLTSLFRFLLFLSVGYLLIRSLPWVRSQLLWRLRNRLIVAYLFIAVVPVILLLTMAGVASYLIYLQLGAHLLQDDLQERCSKISAIADAISGAILREVDERAVPLDSSILTRSDVVNVIDAARADWPGLRVELNRGQRLLRGDDGRSFAGLVEFEKKLWIASAVTRQAPRGPILLSVATPLTSSVLDGLGSELGPIQLILFEPAAAQPSGGILLEIEGRRYVPGEKIASRRRALAAPASWFDLRVNGASTLEAAHLEGGSDPMPAPVLASFSLRPSALNRRLFTSVGALGPALELVLAIVGVLFLVLEIGALITGVVLTRTITHAVGDLYAATLHVRRGDFRHRVRVQKRDQLGALGESFNEMTSSIAELIEKQRQAQKLENEISIAREVQSQLFPQSLPSLPGLDLAAICRAARTVSGDYYDFIRLGPTSVGIAIADISGKGISAALLMASLQAALRSQTLLDGHLGTAELVARLNQHLFKNTSDDRYATFFYAVYDSRAGTLTYTNAGHLPPYFLSDGQVQKLEDGGTVVGLFEDCNYSQSVITVAPGGLLVAFSDGLVEPENVYGEEFGIGRLKEEILRHRESGAQRLAETLISAAEQWAGSPEQADDITVVVARMAQVLRDGG